MPEHRAAALSELADDKPHLVELDGTKVVLIRRGGTVHALAGLCPHKKVPLDKGIVAGDTIVCGVHRAAFRLDTGEVTRPPACENLARYQVRIDAGTVHVTIPEDHEAHPIPAMAAKRGTNRHFAIVGAGAAGWRAAETLRREGFGGRITVITDEKAQPYDRTDLSKSYLGPDEPDDVTIRTKEQADEAGIEIVHATVLALDPKAKTLTLKNGTERTLAFDRALIATGAAANVPDMAGTDLDGVHTLRSLSDAKALRGSLNGASRAVIVGGGFIGFEAAAALSKRDGLDVTLVVREAVPFEKQFGTAFGNRLVQEHRDAGVTVLTGTRTQCIEGEGAVEGVVVPGRTLPADIVILATGARPRTDWLPFETGDDGAVAVNEGLAVEGCRDIFAAGDIARVPTPWGKVRIEHWRFAQECGEVAARSMLGQDARYDGTPFFWTMQQIAGSYTYTGHADGWDEMDGDVLRKDFAASLMQHGKVAAVLAHGIMDAVTATEPRMAGRGPLPREEAPPV